MRTTLRTCATAKKEADHEKRFDIPGGAGGEQGQAGADRKAAGRSAGWPCPHPRRSLRRVPLGFGERGGDIADRVAEGSGPRGGGTDRGYRQRRSRRGGGPPPGGGLPGGWRRRLVVC